MRVNCLRLHCDSARILTYSELSEACIKRIPLELTNVRLIQGVKRVLAGL